MLHGRAAEWLSENGYIDIAVEHALAAGRSDETAALVQTSWVRYFDARLGSTVSVVTLTMRETDLLKRLAEFCSNEEIAENLVPQHGQDPYAVAVSEVVGHPPGRCRTPRSGTRPVLRTLAPVCMHGGDRRELPP
jgi:hypothetical protein